MKISDIETNRCILKEICIDDAEQIVAWRSNPEIYKYFKFPVKINLESHLKWFEGKYKNDSNRIDFIAFLKENNTKIGVFSVNRNDNTSIEVSYLLDSSYQGKGYASEILNALEMFFSKLWSINIFIAEIHKNNINSILFIKNNGYTESEIIDNFIIFSKTL